MSGMGRRLGAVIGVMLLAGCAMAGGAPQFAEGGVVAPTDLPDGAVATSPLGAYLSGRVAQDEHDLPAALAFFEDSLAHEPDNPELIARVFVLAVSEGRFEVAHKLAEKMAKADPKAGLANVVEAVEALKDGRTSRAVEAAQSVPDEGIYREFGSFVRAWSRFADDPKTPAAAVAALAGLDRSPSEIVLQHLHTALIEDLAGNPTAAAAEYGAVIGTGKPSLRLVQLAGNFLERNGQRDQAGQLYDTYMAANPESGVVLAVSDRSPAPLVKTPAAGLAEGLFDLASLVGQADAPEVALISLRLALELQPDFPIARVVLADSLAADHREAAALALYRAIDPASPFYWTARLRAAGVMDDAGDHDGAKQSLTAMAAERPDQALPLVALGDLLHQQKQDQAAIDAYSAALTRLGATVAPRYWLVYYNRGAAYQALGQWQPAEADLRHALTLAPDEPELLNYLGYSLIEHNAALGEAQGMLRRAVELRPDDGFIVDSLGWAYFHLGKYGDAQKTLEHAVELKPEDAEINDHLGDAYWQGGKHDEARLQWRRALSLNPDPDLAKAIGAKLERPPAPKHGPAPSHHAKATDEP